VKSGGIDARAQRVRSRVLALLLLLTASNPSAATSQPRIASLNLCTDSMLLELGPALNVVSVTHLAQQPALSPFAERAKQIPGNHGLAEEIIARAPDLILTGNSTADATGALLTRLGFRVEHFPTARSLASFTQDFRRLGRLLRREHEVEGLLAALQVRLSNLPTPHAGRQESALLISGNGYVPGPETLADDLLAAAGLRNAAADFGVQGGGFLSLERLLQKPPQWLLLGSIGSTEPALAEAYLLHPAVRHAVADARHLIIVPEALWACGGTYFADAVTLIARGLAAVHSPARP
jgi:iron complex transport system substrate-binding protein